MLSFDTGQPFVITHVVAAFLIVKNVRFLCVFETFTNTKAHCGSSGSLHTQSLTILVQAVHV